jgi:hypothetical protein
LATVTLKKVIQTYKHDLQLKTTKFEISGKAPFVEKFVLIKEKKNYSGEIALLIYKSCID